MTDKVSRARGAVTTAADDHTVPPGPVTKPTATDAAASTTVTRMMIDDAGETERCCWICFATDDDNRLAAWVKPCQCRGTTKWVHQSCLYRWIDEKMNSENALRAVSCPQCRTEYIIIFPQMGKFGAALEALDTLISRLCPFLAAGFFVCSIYWSAVTFGAITFLQVVGHDTGMYMMRTGDPVLLLLGLPIIPIGLVLLRMIRWENVVLRMIQGREMMVRYIQFVTIIYTDLNQDEEVEQLQQQGFISYPAPRPMVMESASPVRVFCGALLLPTISSVVGKILFESVESPIQRTLLGGLAFVTIKGVLKIYLSHKQYTSRRNRRVMDYTEENIRTYMPRNVNVNNNGQNAYGNRNNGTRQG